LLSSLIKLGPLPCFEASLRAKAKRVVPVPDQAKSAAAVVAPFHQMPPLALPIAMDAKS
jgi:hypothetical protein